MPLLATDHCQGLMGKKCMVTKQYQTSMPQGYRDTAAKSRWLAMCRLSCAASCPSRPGRHASSQVVAAAYPWIAKRLLTDPSEDTRKLLQSLLYEESGVFSFARMQGLLINAGKP